MTKINEAMHVTSDGVLKRNPRKSSYDKAFYENVILDAIDSSDYGVKVDSPKEKLEFLKKVFVSTVASDIKRYGEAEAFRQWIMGLPSVYNIPFTNHDILELAKKGGSLPENATEKQEDKILENYWAFMTFQTFKLFRKYKVN